jgi:RHS repeat-associated protein
MTNSAGAVTDTYVYWGFGSMRTTNGSSVNLYRFAGSHGYYLDSDTTDYYVRMRHYDPSVGRWLTYDPIGYLAGDINLFRYVGNNPRVKTDPTGLKECYCTLAECLELDPINNALNAEINRQIQAAVSTTELLTEFDLFNRLARDVPKTVPPETWIEDWIRDKQRKYCRNPPNPPISAIRRPYYAACIRIDCGFLPYCVGTDKIGHFFQQGHMLYELMNALGKRKPPLEGWDIVRIVKEWSAATEGFPLDPKTADILRELSWLKFYGMPSNNPFYYLNIWGGLYINLVVASITTARSLPDLAANLKGLNFWQQVLANPRGFKFDICNFISRDWLEAYAPP